MGNRLRSAETPDLAAHEPTVSRELVAEAPLTGYTLGVSMMRAAELKLAAPVPDHVVLPRDKPVPVSD